MELESPGSYVEPQASRHPQENPHTFDQVSSLVEGTGAEYSSDGRIRPEQHFSLLLPFARVVVSRVFMPAVRKNRDQSLAIIRIMRRRRTSHGAASLKPLNLSDLEQGRWLNEHVPYRIKMLDGLQDFVTTGGRNGPLEPAFPSIFEGALIACRWTGNFLGLYVNRNGVLCTARERPHDGDVFSTDLGGKLVDVRLLTDEQRKVLATVLRGADIATAHPTRENIHAMTWADVRKASPLLVEQLRLNLYDELKLPLPQWKRPV